MFLLRNRNIKDNFTRLREKFLPSGKSISLAVSGLLFMTLSSCVADKLDKEDEPDPVFPEEKEEVYYISIEVTTPSDTGTRSDTDNSKPGDSTDETEPGTADETKITSASIFLCSSDDKIVVKLIADEEIPVPANGKTLLKAEVNKDKLNELAELAGKETRIYIVANETESFIGDHGFKGDVTAGKASFIVSDLDAYPLGKFGTSGHIMPLSNAKQYVIDRLPIEGITSNSTLYAKTKAIKTLFTRASENLNWWDINNVIDLERSVARIEFKDADRTSSTTPFPATPYVYPIKDMEVKLELFSMQMFNVNPESYLFRHTNRGDAKKAGSANATQLFGVEKDNTETDKIGTYNWIATPGWQYNSGWGKSNSDYLNKLTINEDDEIFEIVNGSATSTEALISIETLKSHITATASNPPSSDGYMPWCYVTENTLPSIDLMEPVDEDGELLAATYATGVAFKFLVLDKDGKKPLEYSTMKENYPSEVVNSITSQQAMEEHWITITDPNGNWVDVKPEGGKYYLTYIACIVHNENASKDTDANFAPMYYAVVRNNTYQMSIKSVSSLPNPKDPKSLYLQLDINVKPWVVRDNEIEF